MLFLCRRNDRTEEAQSGNFKALSLPALCRDYPVHVCHVILSPKKKKFFIDEKVLIV